MWRASINLKELENPHVIIDALEPRDDMDLDVRETYEKWLKEQIVHFASTYDDEWPDL